MTYSVKTPSGASYTMCPPASATNPITWPQMTLLREKRVTEKSDPYFRDSKRAKITKNRRAKFRSEL